MEHNMHPDCLEMVYTQEQIAKRVAELGVQLTADYRGKDLLVIGLLKGSLIFMSDLIRAMDVDMAIEAIRAALSRTITRRFCEDGQLRVVTLDAEVEKRIIASITRNEQGVYLAMGPDLMHQIVSQMAEHMRKFADLSQTPIILVSQVIRGYFSKMITQFYPNIYVLSFNEITSNVQIQALGNITLDAPARMDRSAGVNQ